jgi:nucleoside-diphosphate-sugar epimerase
MLIGRGDNLVDTTYVDNAARAHLDAFYRLAPGRPPAGCSYFISQGDPRPLRDILNELMRAAELPPVKKSIPFSVAYVAACLLESFYRIFRVTAEPPLTRYLVLKMARDQYFDITAARRDLGYNPAISVKEGMQRLRQVLSAETAMTTSIRGA